MGVVKHWLAQRGGEYSIPRNIQGQAGQGSKEPGLVEDVPVHCQGIGIDEF